MHQTWHIKVVEDLPSEPSALTIYYLRPKAPWEEVVQSGIWHEQLTREIGIYTIEERLVLSTDTVLLIVGAGGMGASIALLAARGHIGTMIISDPDTISLSNVNRQAQTHSENVGRMKVFELARNIRQITPNTAVVIVPTGITPEIFDQIVAYTGAPDLAFDEIELFEKEARISTHMMLRKHGIPMINCNAVMFGSYCFLLTNEGRSLVEMLEYTESAMEILLSQMREGTAHPDDEAELEARLFAYLIPELNEYALDRNVFSTVANWHEGVRKRAVLVTGTTPTAAAAIAFTYGIQHVLRMKLGNRFNRKVLEHPIQPGYVYRDFLIPNNTRIVSGPWFSFPLIHTIGHER